MSYRMQRGDTRDKGTKTVMEEDRYKKNSSLFIIAMLAMTIGFVLLAFTLYILPFLLFGWIYDVPSGIIYLQEWVHTSLDFTESDADKLILSFFTGLALIFIVVAYITSNRIENQIFKQGEEEPKKRAHLSVDTQESFSLTLKLLLVIIVIFILAYLVPWYFLYQSAPQMPIVQKPYVS